LSGGSIGAVGASLRDLREGAASIFEREVVRRGCSTCEAKSYCSQCLFTDPFDTATFCAIQRDNRALASLLDGITLGRALMGERDDVLPKDDFIIQTLCGLPNSVQVNGEDIPLSSCLLLFAEHTDYAYLHSPRYGLLAKLTMTQRMAIENLE
jgi:hypothetical protein